VKRMGDRTKVHRRGGAQGGEGGWLRARRACVLPCVPVCPASARCGGPPQLPRADTAARARPADNSSGRRPWALHCQLPSPARRARRGTARLRPCCPKTVPAAARTSRSTCKFSSACLLRPRLQTGRRQGSRGHACAPRSTTWRKKLAPPTLCSPVTHAACSFGGLYASDACSGAVLL